MSDKTDSIIARLPATPPQVFTDEKGCFLAEESPWEGYSEVSQIIPLRREGLRWIRVLKIAQDLGSTLGAVVSLSRRVTAQTENGPGRS